MTSHKTVSWIRDAANVLDLYYDRVDGYVVETGGRYLMDGSAAEYYRRSLVADSLEVGAGSLVKPMLRRPVLVSSEDRVIVGFGLVSRGPVDNATAASVLNEFAGDDEVTISTSFGCTGYDRTPLAIVTRVTEVDIDDHGGVMNGTLPKGVPEYDGIQAEIQRASNVKWVHATLSNVGVRLFAYLLAQADYVDGPYGKPGKALENMLSEDFVPLISLQGLHNTSSLEHLEVSEQDMYDRGCCYTVRRDLSDNLCERTILTAQNALCFCTTDRSHQPPQFSAPGNDGNSCVSKRCTHRLDVSVLSRQNRAAIENPERCSAMCDQFVAWHRDASDPTAFDVDEFNRLCPDHQLVKSTGAGWPMWKIALAVLSVAVPLVAVCLVGGDNNKKKKKMGKDS